MANIEIFTSPNCNYCKEAKALLQHLGLSYQQIDIAENDENRAAFIERLPRERSVPQIFINGEHIGGFNDLELMNKDGRLRRLTEQGHQAGS